MVLILTSRETKEECGLEVSQLDEVGTLIFEFIGEAQLLEVHVFRTEHFTGTVTESEGQYHCIMCCTDCRNSTRLNLLVYCDTIANTSFW